MSTNKDIDSTTTHNKVKELSTKEPEDSSLTSETSRKEKRCVDCEKLIVDDKYGICVEKHTHTVNHENGYLCSQHWQRALNHKESWLKGKCDQCCWWEIT